MLIFFLDIFYKIQKFLISIFHLFCQKKLVLNKIFNYFYLTIFI